MREKSYEMILIGGSLLNSTLNLEEIDNVLQFLAKMHRWNRHRGSPVFDLTAQGFFPQGSFFLLLLCHTGSAGISWFLF